MDYLFTMIWDILLNIFGLINQLVGYLLDIKFFDVPILLYLVFFDLFLRLIQYFSGDKIGMVTDDSEDDEEEKEEKEDDDETFEGGAGI